MTAKMKRRAFITLLRGGAAVAARGARPVPRDPLEVAGVELAGYRTVLAVPMQAASGSLSPPKR